MKKLNIMTSAIFFMYIFIFFIVNVMSSDKTFSELENRTLSAFPKFSTEQLFSGEYTQKLDTYITDQFVLRDKFVEIKSSIENILGKMENNGVYITTENTLIDKFPVPNYTNIDKSITAINNFKETVNVPVNLVVIPTQNDIYSYKLPQNTPINSQKDMIDYIYDKIEGSIDVYDKLMSHNDEYIFYNTDHHWTSLGAYYAYEQIMETLGKTPVSIDDLEKTTVTGDFNGTIFSKSGVRYVTPDIIDIYTQNQSITVQDADGFREELLYDMTKLENKDKYEVFLGGNDPIVIVEGKGEGTLLLVKDSYSNSLVPFLTENYASIHMVDLRFMKMPMSQYIMQNRVSEVLVCYSAGNFESDSNIIFLK